jgi:glycosyltransferase involved in cell wall biosynthesis
LKIGIDARRVGRYPSGIGRYTLNLLKGLALVGPPWRVTVFVSSMSDVPGDLASAPLFDFVEMTRRPLTLSNQVTMPFTLRRLGIDVLHCLDAFAPLASGCRKIITLYDLIPLTCRHLLYAGAKARFAPLWKAWLKWQCRRASAVVTLSEHSAGDINRLLNVPLEKIRIIPASVDAPVAEKDRIDVRRKFNIKGRILLYVGRRDPYKNLAGLVRAFALIKRNASKPVCLVIAGPPDARFQEPEKEAERLGLGDSVVITGFVSDKEIASLYRAADVFMFPSLYEGFGLPPLEAMSYGLPVVAGNTTSLPDALGDAAVLVDPNNIQEIADAATRLLSDSVLAGQMREKGHKRAALFTVKRQGEETMRLYESLLKNDSH